MSDAVLFALLFATYASMTNRLASGPSGSDLFKLGGVLAETLVLLFSTLTFGLASATLKALQRLQVLGWLMLTGLLGPLFLGLEYRELTGMLAKDAGSQRSGFLSAFFVLLTTHGLHVLARVAWLCVMMIQTMVLPSATSAVAPATPWVVLALSRYCVDRYLFSRLSCRSGSMTSNQKRWS